MLASSRGKRTWIDLVDVAVGVEVELNLGIRNEMEADAVGFVVEPISKA